jgi:hypothetical protein
MKTAIIIHDQKVQRVFEAPDNLDGKDSDNNALLAKIYDEANTIGEADAKSCGVTAWVTVQFWNPATSKMELEQTFDYTPNHFNRPNRRIKIANPARH